MLDLEFFGFETCLYELNQFVIVLQKAISRYRLHLKQFGAISNLAMLLECPHDALAVGVFEFDFIDDFEGDLIVVLCGCDVGGAPFVHRINIYRFRF